MSAVDSENRRSESAIRRAAVREGFRVRVRRSGTHAGWPQLYDMETSGAALAEDAGWSEIESFLFSDSEGGAASS